MKRLIAISLQFLLVSIAYCQNIEEQNLNFGFELINKSSKTPLNWIIYPNSDYKIEIDSLTKYSGKYSLKIESQIKQNIKSSGIVLIDFPANFECKLLEVRVKMKVRDISQGIADFGLLELGETKTLQTSDISDKKLTGNVDWTDYSVTAPFCPETRTCSIVVQLTGTGTIWIDDFQVFIDGENYFTSKKRFGFYAKLDKEYDNGSSISIPRLNTNIISNLTITAKIWGFLKYYHPNVAKGLYNWDYELFRIIPEILQTSNSLERNNALSKWIKKVGTIESFQVEQKLDSNSIKIYPDLNWTEDKKVLGNEIVKQLETIKNAERNHMNYFVEFGYALNPSFKNENSYISMKYPDTGFRLLSLFRIWNIIQYYYPYKYLLDGDWNNVLPEFISKFVNANNETEYRIAILELLTHINDSHATIPIDDEIINDYKGRFFVPIEVSFVENKLVVTDFLNEEAEQKSQLKRGDILISINGEATNSIVKKRLRLTSGSNYPTKLRNVARDFLRTNDKQLKIEYESNSVRNSQNISCIPFDYMAYYSAITLPKEDFAKLLTKDVGYINLGCKMTETLSKTMIDFKNTKGIIIDLRYMPDFQLIFSLGEFILQEPREFAKYTHTNNHTPGLFSYSPTLKIGKTNPKSYTGKIVILINENSQSRAEYAAMAFKTAPNSLIIGSTTAGADGDVSNLLLPGNVMTMFSGIGIYYPDGNETQRTGIIPDVIVKPTIKGIKEKRDELIDTAIRLITEK